MIKKYVEIKCQDEKHRKCYTICDKKKFTKEYIEDFSSCIIVLDDMVKLGRK